MNVGVIGTGTMGRNHVRIYSEMRGIDDVFIFDADNESAERMRHYGAKVCASVDQVLDNVDAVSICVPTKHHFAMAKKAIEKNVSMLIEKPITSSVEEGEELIRLLGNTDLIAGVGHIERFNPVVSEIKKLLTKPYYIEIKRHNPTSGRIEDVSVIEDLMIHDIDIIYNAFFPGTSGSLTSMGNEDVCSALIKFENSTVSLSASRKSSKKIRKVYVEEEEFTIEGDFMSQEIYIYRKPEKYGAEEHRYVQENIVEKVLLSKLEPLRVELRAFIECVKKHEQFYISPEQALENLKTCEKIRQGIK